MSLINITTSQDVNKFVAFLGVDALINLHKSPLVSHDTKQLIRDTIKLANLSVIDFDSFNDGNINWSEVVYIDFENILQSLYVRSGFGEGKKTLDELIKTDKPLAEKVAKRILDLQFEQMNLSYLKNIQL